MFNIQCLGRLVRDAEISFSKDGKAITRITIAVNESKDKVSYYNFTAFNKTAEILGNYGRKGKMLFIENATLYQNKYENKEGKTVYNKEMIIYSFKLL